MRNVKLSQFQAQSGLSTVELLIAFGIAIVILTAATVVSFGNQSVVLDTALNHEALGKVERKLGEARAQAFVDFNSLVSTPPTADDIYTQELVVTDLTPCRKRLTSKLTWTTQPIRPQKIEATTDLGDIGTAISMGGDCDSDPPGSNWNNPQTFASDNFAPGKPTAIDSLNRIVYMGSNKTPFLQIADTSHATLGQSSGLFVTYANGYNVGREINSLDATRWTDPATGAVKRYVYAAMKTTTNQFKIIDVTDIHNPFTVSTISLSSCVTSTGSQPQGYRIYYYGNRVYLTTRETAGPEFHVFDVSNPVSAYEIGTGSCLGYELNRTINGIIVRDQTIPSIPGVGSPTIKRIAYLASDNDPQELTVLDITDPFNITKLDNASVDLSGSQDAMSVYLVGNNLYLGRASNPSGSDLYVFDATDPYAAIGGLPLKTGQDIGTSASWVRVAGRFAFVGTTKSSQEFQVWDITTNPISEVSHFNFPNLADAGIDYEPDFVYATGQGNDSLRIIYSP